MYAHANGTLEYGGNLDIKLHEEEYLADTDVPEIMAVWVVKPLKLNPKLTETVRVIHRAANHPLRISPTWIDSVDEVSRWMTSEVESFQRSNWPVGLGFSLTRPKIKAPNRNLTGTFSGCAPP